MTTTAPSGRRDDGRARRTEGGRLAWRPVRLAPPHAAKSVKRMVHPWFSPGDSAQMLPP